MMEQRDLLLVPFPFSDQSGRKVRPVVVISNDGFNERSEDILVVGVTSATTKERYAVPLNNKDLENGRLIVSCKIKCENILKIDKGLVVKRIGKLSQAAFNKIKEVISEIIR